jgi:hypothetical protein
VGERQHCMDCGNKENLPTYDLCSTCTPEKHAKDVGHTYFECYPDSDLHCLAWYQVRRCSCNVYKKGTIAKVHQKWLLITYDNRYWEEEQPDTAQCKIRDEEDHIVVGICK